MHLLEYLLSVIALAAALAGVIYLCRRDAGREAARSPFVRRCLAAAFSALLLYLLIQSGIERRLGPDLLLPFRAGSPAPGRAVCLCASLLFCFAAAMTDAGRRARAALDRLCGRDRGRFAAAAVVAALFFLWATRVTVLQFMTNDDTSLLRTISGIPEKGLVSASTAFSTVLFCGFVSLFYRLWPGGYWYTLYHLTAIFVSCVIIGRCILLKTSRRRWPALAGIFFHVLVCGGVFLYPLARLSFTVTPALVGAAATALVFCRGDLRTRGGRTASDIASVVLMLLCYLQRTSTGRCALCFFALAAVYQAARLLLSRRPDGKRQLWGLCVTVLAALALCYAGRSVRLTDSQSADPEYQDARQYRIIVTDYLMADLTDEQFAAVGIPPELAVLVRNWYFMDERVNVDSFRALVDLYYDPLSASSESALPAALFTALRDLAGTLASSALWASTACAALVLFLLTVLGLIRFGRSALPEFLCALCALGGGFLLSFYLVLRGRFPFRAYLVVILPAILLLLMAALTAPEDAPVRPQRRTAAAGGLLLAVLCTACALMVYNTPYVAEYADRESVFSVQWTVEAYENEHPDERFISNLLVRNLDPFHTKYYPGNVQSWGGSGTITSKNRVYAQEFFKEDVRLLYEPMSTLIGMLQYLTLDHGPVQAVNIPLIEYINVADLTQIGPGEAYTGWYEQNGMTYYFEDGQAVTGTHTIDGAEYEFAPAGRDAQLIILPGEPTVYTTDAYSLVGAP